MRHQQFGRNAMRPRHGFTLIEMLVSMALIVFIMVILTEAFVTGMDSLRDLRVIGEMQEGLRTATTILRKDLAADHFTGKKRLSDPDLWADGPPEAGYFRIWQGSPPDHPDPTNPQTVNPNANGRYVYEGKDGDDIPSYRATDHMLQFTVKKRGNRPEEFPSASVPALSPLIASGFGPDARFQQGNTYSSQWYDVAYFLRSTGESANGTPLFALYRRQQLAVTDPTTINWDNSQQNKQRVPVTQLPLYAEISCQPNLRQANQNFLYFNSPESLTVPQHRFGMTIANQNIPGGYPSLSDKTVDQVINPQDARTWTLPVLSDPAAVGGNPSLAGSDLLLTNVISFQVQVDVGNGYQDLSALGPGNNPAFNAVSPQNNLPNGPFVFDTWSGLKDEWSDPANQDQFDYTPWSDNDPKTVQQDGTQRLPLRVRILALKITLRIWDLKSNKTRQITIIQDM